MDNVVQRTVIALNQAKAYCRYMGIKFKASHSNNKYKFGNDRQVEIGSISIRNPFPNNTGLIEKVDVVNKDAPFLLGLDFLDNYHMYVNNVFNHLVCEELYLKLQISLKCEHLYLEYSGCKHILYTRNKLLKLHRNFSHPSTDELLNLLKIVQPWETDDKTKGILEEIVKNAILANAYDLHRPELEYHYQQKKKTQSLEKNYHST